MLPFRDSNTGYPARGLTITLNENELLSTWKEAVTVRFTMLSKNLLRETEEKHKNLSKFSRFRGVEVITRVFPLRCRSADISAVTLGHWTVHLMITW
jgi:hypothetical protein